MSDTGVYKISTLLQAQKYYARVPNGESAPVPDEIIIKFRPSAGFDPDKLETRSARLNSALKKHGVHKAVKLHKGKKKNQNEKAAKVGIDRIYSLKVPRGSNIQMIINELRVNPEVEYVEPNYTVKVKLTPNDPSFSLQWGLGPTKTNLQAAWNLHTGSNTVVVAVVDTGVAYNHADLAANMWTNTGEIPGNGIDDDANGIIDDDKGWDYANNDNDPMDDHYHGTHVAGIIGAVGNNGVGISGVNWTVKIMPIKFLNSSGSGSYSDAVLALTYAADNGANVINNSWGGYYYSQAVKDAVEYAQASGCIVVAAAGNSNTDLPMYPAALRNVISVAATDSSDNKASFSNYGPFIDVSAPGVGILSTLLGNTYGNLSGTSMASPFVAGLAALVKAKNPTFSNEDIRQVVLTSTDDLGTPGWDSYFGYGRINAFKALQTTSVLVSNITSPNWNSVLNNIFSVSGTSAGTGFNRFEIAWGSGLNPSSWSTAGVSLSGGGMSPVNNGVLAAIDATFIPTDGDFTVRIRSYDSASQVYEDRVPLKKNSILKSGWPIDNISAEWGSPILADINRDSKVEIILGTYDPSAEQKMHVLNENGNNLLNWPYSGGEWVMAPSAGDIDGDGFLDVVAHGQLTTLYAWKNDASFIPGWPKDFGQLLGWEPPMYCTLSDVLKTGRDQIIFSSSWGSRYIHLIDEQGVDAPGWPVAINSNQLAPSAVGDVDHDGEDEIVVSTDTGEVHVYKKDGSELAGWPKTGLTPPSGMQSHSPVLADVDNDGFMEIFAVGWDTIYGWRYDGSVLPGWPKTVPGAEFTSIAIGDITGDDKYEILSDDSSAGASLYAWDHQGNLVPGWPVPGIMSASVGPIICDVDGDGKNDVLIPNLLSTGLHIFNGNGTPLNNWPFTPPSWELWTEAFPAVGDIDGDGKCELVFRTHIKTYVFDMPGIYNPHKAPWPMIHRDAKHTSCIPYSFRTSNPLVAGQVNDTNGANTFDIDVQIEKDRVSATYGGFVNPDDGNEEFTYEYAVGTSPLATDVVTRRSNSANTSFTETGLSLTVGTKYYTTVWATDSHSREMYAVSDGVTIIVTPIKKATGTTGTIPTTFNAYNYPNPFYMSKGPTTIRCELPKDGTLSVQIFDRKGRLMHHLVNEEKKSAGVIDIRWDGKTDKGASVPENVYFCVVTVTANDGKKYEKKFSITAVN